MMKEKETDRKRKREQCRRKLGKQQTEPETKDIDTPNIGGISNQPFW